VLPVGNTVAQPNGSGGSLATGAGVGAGVAAIGAAALLRFRGGGLVASVTTLATGFADVLERAAVGNVMFEKDNSC
jgi:hypothetical protein